MASNYNIARRLLDFSKGRSEAEINKITGSVIKTYGKRSQSILLALKSIIQLSDSNITVITANALDSRHQNDLTNAFKARRQPLNFVTDPYIIGGIIVKIGDHIIDNSLATRINGAKDIIIRAQVN